MQRKGRPIARLQERSFRVRQSRGVGSSHENIPERMFGVETQREVPMSISVRRGVLLAATAVLLVALGLPAFAGGQKEGGAAQGAPAAGGKIYIPFIC